VSYVDCQVYADGVAKVVNMVDKLGCIKPGAFADFLLLGANPLEDIGIMNKPHQYLKAVIKDGRCVKSNVKGLSVEISLD
jgi:imidazolonepropionase-like amidohydrolase